MKGIRAPWLICLFLNGGTCAAAGSPPSTADIQAWWSHSTNEKLMLNEPPVAIRLASGELAYLQNAMFGGSRSRNGMFGMVIVRPEEQLAQEIPFLLGRYVKVLDLDKDGVSEVETTRIESGGGATYGHTSLVQFDGWEAVVLYQSTFESNEGTWGTRSDRYRAKELDWQYVDLDADGHADLLETITHKFGRNNRKPVTSSARYRYVFKNDQIIRLVTYQQSQR
jgi:hypothetical protein